MNDLISRLRDYRVSADPEHPVHPAICDEAILEIERLKLINAEFKRVDAPRATLETLVRLGYEMEVLSTMRCCELLGENINVFRDRGWEQSVIRDALMDGAERIGEHTRHGLHVTELVKRWDAE